MTLADGCHQCPLTDGLNVQRPAFVILIFFRFAVSAWQVGDDIFFPLKHAVLVRKVERAACRSGDNHHIAGAEFGPSSIPASLLYGLIKFCVCYAVAFTFNDSKWP